MRLIDIFDFIEKNKITDFGILLCIYRRVFDYIHIVRGHKNYISDEIEPLIKKVLMHIDSNIVYTEFFSIQEQNILKEYTKENLS